MHVEGTGPCVLRGRGRESPSFWSGPERYRSRRVATCVVSRQARHQTVYSIPLQGVAWVWV